MIRDLFQIKKDYFLSIFLGVVPKNSKNYVVVVFFMQLNKYKLFLLSKVLFRNNTHAISTYIYNINESCDICK